MKSKVLIIDDEKDICFLISEILRDEDYITTSSNNSKDALNIFSTFTVLLSGSTYNPLQKNLEKL